MTRENGRTIQATGYVSDEIVDVPEEPFGIPVSWWKIGLALFTLVLVIETVLLLIQGGTPHVIGALYAVPAILYAYFYRRKGVLLVYLLAMFFFIVVVIFRYPSVDDLVAAAFRAVLLIAIALTVSYLTHFLLLEKRKYHAIFDNTENGVIVVNIHTRAITEMNQRFSSLTGYHHDGNTPPSLEDYLISPDQVGIIFTSLESQCSAPASEVLLRRRDGSTWAAIIVGRKIAADHAVMTFIDITERRKIDEQLRQCNADSNLYLDILTHDINNMNTASLSYCRLLLNRPGVSHDDLAQRLSGSLEKTDDIIRNISILRQLNTQETALGRVPLAEVIRKEIAAFPGARIEYDGTEAGVLADDMLGSVFANLVGNSLKYGGKETRIVIRAATRQDDVVVTIEDDGHGIPDDVKPIIFDRFRRGDTTVSGKGLGLFICKSLIDRYGGTIMVSDRVPADPSKGVLFRFTLKKA